MDERVADVAPLPVTASPLHGVLTLSGPLGAAGADALRSALLRGLHEANLIVDLAQVESCDATALQLLLAAQTSATQRGRQMTLRNIPRAVESVAVDLGLPSRVLR